MASAQRTACEGAPSKAMRKASPIGLDLAPAEAVDLAAHRGLVGAEQVAPARVAQARRVAGRPDDVAEDDGQQVARDRAASARR
jgi:hypothetical protein